MNVDLQTLIHIGTELVIFAGFFFWSKGRFAKTDDAVKTLVEKIEQLEQIIGQQNALLQRHEAMFARLFGEAPPPPRAPQEQPGPPAKSNPLPVRNTAPPPSPAAPTSAPARPAHAHTPSSSMSASGCESEDEGGVCPVPPRGRPQPPPREEEPDYTPSDIDRLLTEELKGLKSGNKKPSTPTEGRKKKRLVNNVREKRRSTDESI